MATTSVKDIQNEYYLKVNADGSINTSGGGSGGGSVDLNDGAGNPIGSTSGALNVSIQGSTNVTTTEAGLTNFQTSQYTIGTAVVQITATPLTGRSSISLRVTATGSNAIFIGNSAGLTTTNGYPLYNGDTLQMDLTPTNSIYAVASAAGQTLYVLEIA